ncbi:hypothetical protein B0H13DRAFT_2335498 [Mycena leptocephala]|nr:hypothetical protein B0H13DRAFT_2335498 [Mycena leptocephala]
MSATPSDAELIDWLYDYKSCTLLSIRRAAAAKDPAWIISEKRLRRMRVIETNAAVLQLTESRPNSRDCVRHALSVASVSGADNTAALENIATFMAEPDPILAGTLYESNPNTIDWYYEIYASRSATATNTIASTIFGRPIRGPITIVKNGPVGGRFSRLVDKKEIVNCLWYYLASGVDPVETASVRALERMIRS